MTLTSPPRKTVTCFGIRRLSRIPLRVTSLPDADRQSLIRAYSSRFCPSFWLLPSHSNARLEEVHRPIANVVTFAGYRKFAAGSTIDFHSSER